MESQYFVSEEPNQRKLDFFMEFFTPWASYTVGLQTFSVFKWSKFTPNSGSILQQTIQWGASTYKYHLDCHLSGIHTSSETAFISADLSGVHTSV